MSEAVDPAGTGLRGPRCATRPDPAAKSSTRRSPHEPRVVEDVAGERLTAGPGEGPERRRQPDRAELLLGLLPELRRLVRHVQADLRRVGTRRRRVSLTDEGDRVRDHDVERPRVEVSSPPHHVPLREAVHDAGPGRLAHPGDVAGSPASSTKASARLRASFGGHEHALRRRRARACGIPERRSSRWRVRRRRLPAECAAGPRRPATAGSRHGGPARPRRRRQSAHARRCPDSWLHSRRVRSGMALGFDGSGAP